MNKLQAMEVFVQVVDAGGFSRAADLMQLPKATVSTLIQQLETSLSVKLLHRTTRQVSVTADGAAYYERCLRILSDVKDAEESLSRTRLSPSGRLRVESPTGLASEILVPALPGFFERYPDIQLELGVATQCGKCESCARAVWSECCRSQWWKEMVSSSRALGCAHGSVAPISATSPSRRATRGACGIAAPRRRRRE